MTIYFRLVDKNNKNFDRKATEWLEDYGQIDVIDHYSRVITFDTLVNSETKINGKLVNVPNNAVLCQLKNKKNKWELYYRIWPNGRSNYCVECETEIVVKNMKNPKPELIAEVKRVTEENLYCSL